MKRIDIDGGAIQTLITHGSNVTTGAWSKDGTKVFSMLGQPVYRIAAGRGQPLAWPKLMREGGRALHVQVQLCYQRRRVRAERVIAVVDDVHVKMRARQQVRSEPEAAPA